MGMTLYSCITPITQMSQKRYYLRQWRNQLFISGGGNFHELSFDDVIVLIQAWYNSFANGHRYVLFAIFPKMRTY